MRSLKLILILFLVLMVNTCSQAQQMPKSAYKSSVKIELGLKNPNYNRVIDLLEKAKVDYPDDAEIWFLLGKVYGIKNRIKDMLEAFTQANKLSPNKKQKKEMKEIIDKTWVLTFNLGVDYAGRVNKVERYAEESFSNWSNYPNYIDSLQLLSSEFTASNYNWQSCNSNADLAILLEKLKQDLYTKSQELYDLAILLDSTRHEAYVNGAFVSSKLGQSEKALGYFEKAYEMKPDDINVLNNYFAVLLNNKKYEDALAISQEILKKTPDDLTVLFNQAVILENLGREQETMELYNKIIERDPNSKDVYFDRALLYLNKTSQIAKQLIALRDSMEINPDAQTLVDRSNQLIEEQKTFFHKSELDFKKVLELAPDDLETMRFLGYCYLNQEKSDDAIKVLEALTQNEPDNKEAWGYLSIAYTKKGLAKKAKEAEKKAQEP